MQKYTRSKKNIADLGQKIYDEAIKHMDENNMMHDGIVYYAKKLPNNTTEYFIGANERFSNKIPISEIAASMLAYFEVISTFKGKELSDEDIQKTITMNATGNVEHINDVIIENLKTQRKINEQELKMKSKGWLTDNIMPVLLDAKSNPTHKAKDAIFYLKHNDEFKIAFFVTTEFGITYLNNADVSESKIDKKKMVEKALENLEKKVDLKYMDMPAAFKSDNFDACIITDDTLPISGLLLSDKIRQTWRQKTLSDITETAAPNILIIPTSTREILLLKNRMIQNAMSEENLKKSLEMMNSIRTEMDISPDEYFGTNLISVGNDIKYV